MTTSPPFLNLNDVSYTVTESGNSLQILKNVNFTLQQGASVAIVGHSGAGKTSLLNMMAGLLSPTEGSIFFKDRDLTKLNEQQRSAWRLNHCGFIFQSFELLEHLTAVENVMLPLELRKEPDALEIAMSYLDKVGLYERAQFFADTLSGGEKQRVAIARALALKPSLLFADEPTGNLDELTGQKIIEMLFEHNERDSTLILVTHSAELAAMCQQQLRLDKGAIIG